MGCQGLNKSYSQENAYISAQEQTLGFTFHSVSVIEANFYRLMQGHYLDPLTYTALKESLSLPNQLDKVLGKVTVKEGQYDGKKLLLYAILLSSGSEREKANAIWNWQNAGSHISTDTLESLLKDLFSLCLILPIDFLPPNKDITTEKINAYLQTNSPKLTKAAKNTCQLFPNEDGKVMRETFVESVGSKTVGIGSTRSVRSMLEATAIMPQRFAAAFQAESGFQAKLQ